MTGSFAIAARVGRLLRVLHLISSVRGLRLIVTALLRSVPSVGYIIILMSILIYVYSVTGYYLFNEADPENWGSLGLASLSMLQLMDVGRLGKSDAPGGRGNPVRVALLREFRDHRHVRRAQPLIAIIINNLNNVREEAGKPPRPGDGKGGASG